jgi:hypothetical protein
VCQLVRNGSWRSIGRKSGSPLEVLLVFLKLGGLLFLEVGLAGGFGATPIFFLFCSAGGRSWPKAEMTRVGPGGGLLGVANEISGMGILLVSDPACRENTWKSAFQE